MTGKPFRPPLLSKLEKPATPVYKDRDEPQAKKRRTSSDLNDNAKLPAPHLVFKKPGISSVPRKPLLAVKNPTGATQAIQPLDGGFENYYNVLWCLVSSELARCGG